MRSHNLNRRLPPGSGWQASIVLQEMKETTMNDCEYRKMQEAEVAEEFALRIALKRVALEEVAKSPSFKGTGL